MPIQFTCRCGKRYVVRDDKVGLRAKCSCGTRFTIPRPGESEPVFLAPDAGECPPPAEAVAPGAGQSPPPAEAAAVTTQPHPVASRAYLGAVLGDPPPNVEGCLVKSVTAGASAGRAGLRPGDLIVSCDGKKVATVEEMRSHLRVADPGSTITVQVYRGAQETSLPVMLAARPQDA
jgi:hypothetical protein